MKTKSAERKLQINRETLRQLCAETLDQVRGGLDDTIVRPSDACGHPTGG